MFHLLCFSTPEFLFDNLKRIISTHLLVLSICWDIIPILSFISLEMDFFSSLKLFRIVNLGSAYQVLCLPSSETVSTDSFFFNLCINYTFLFLCILHNFLLRSEHFEYNNVTSPEI